MNAAPLWLGDRAVRYVHLVGAGGRGMGALGLYLAERGCAVSTEDEAWPRGAQSHWVAAGAELVATPGALPTATGLVVVSRAFGPDHPAWRAAVARGLPVLRRGAVLAELLRDRRLVAVVGAGGRATALAMVVLARRRAGLGCGWLFGGLWRGGEERAPLPPAHDDGEWVVAELDESDGPLAGLAPAVTLAVNLEGESAGRADAPTGWAAELAGLWARTTDAVVFDPACPVARRLAAEAGGSAARCGVGPGREFAWRVARADDAGLTLALGGRFALPEVRVRARAAAEAAPAVAALAAVQLTGAPPPAEALADFPGVARRPAVLHDTPRLTVVEEGARHPAEIREVVRAVRRQAGPGSRVVVVLGSDRPAGTAEHRAGLVAALAGADAVWVLGVESEPELLAAFPAGGTGPVVRPWNGDRAALRAALRPGDTLALVGTIDRPGWAQELLRELAVAPAGAEAWAAWRAEVRPRLGPATILRENEMLGPKTTMRVGGPARSYAEPADEADLRTLLATAYARGLPVFPLGRGSNLLVPDEGVDGLVISLAQPAWQRFHVADDGRVWAGAGLRLKNLCGRALQAGLAGFEFLDGIPATVGGALRMNAGAMGGWMFGVVDEVHLLLPDGTKQVRSAAELHHDYRHCGELETAIALGAWLRPRPAGDPAAIRSALAAGQRQRGATQPREPSAGCIFKNPPGTSAGRLIDQAGLKGERVGDAEVSRLHANFIINRGQATCADILELIRRVRARVRAEQGVELTPEVMLLGRGWREVL